MPTPTNSGQVDFLAKLSSNLCSYGMRRTLLTGFFRDYLAKCFSEEGQIEEPDLLAFLWDKSERTNILIEPSHKYDPNTTEKTPAIYIKRNTYQNARLAIGNFQGIQSRTGDEEFMTTWVGSHTIFCMHGNGAAAELLGTEVERRLTQFEKAITTELRLQKYQVLQVGEISEVENASQNFVVPITIGIAYNESWTLHYEAPVLGKIGINALFGLT